MVVKYQFVMHHSGRLPNPRGLERMAKDNQGKILAQQDYYTGNIFQEFLDNFYPLSDPIEHTGRLVNVSFSTEQDASSFINKLTRIGVRISYSRDKPDVRQAVA
ncbi:MAG: hypothetical protein KKE50_04075 [Nanoarchaeota archaeon]|nr:hypothetical protein [Nanoarchaeota archaeon]